MSDQTPNPTVTVSIVSRWDASRVLFSAEVDASIPVIGRIKAALTIAVGARADLAGAYLAGADLAGADLARADLARAKWQNGITLRRAPLMLYGLDYPVIVLDDHLQIGCELHTIAEWSAFDNERIARMDGARARRFWDRHKAALLALAASDGRGTAPAAQTEEAA